MPQDKNGRSFISASDPNFTGRYNGTDYYNGRGAGNGWKNNFDVQMDEQRKRFQQQQKQRQERERQAEEDKKSAERSERSRQQQIQSEINIAYWRSKETPEQRARREEFEEKARLAREERERAIQASIQKYQQEQREKARRRQQMTLIVSTVLVLSAAFIWVFQETTSAVQGPLHGMLILLEPFLAIVAVAIFLSRRQAAKRDAEIARHMLAQAAAVAAQIAAEKAEAAAEQAAMQAAEQEADASGSADPVASAAAQSLNPDPGTPLPA